MNEVVSKLNKEEFKEKLDRYLKAHEHERDFDNEIKSYPKVLSKLLYDKHEERWKIKAKRIELLDILKNIDEESIQYTINIDNPSPEPQKLQERINFLNKESQINLYNAIPELVSFFERLDSPKFRELTIEKSDTKQSIIEIFLQTENLEKIETEENKPTEVINDTKEDKPLEEIIKEIEKIVENEAINRENLSKATHKIRKHLNEKSKEFISPAEHIYFFRYTHIKIRMLNEEEEQSLKKKRKEKNIAEDKIRKDISQMSAIELQVPISANELSPDKTPYIMKKFDTEFLPWLRTILNQEMKTEKKNRIYTYSISNDQAVYEARKKEIGSQQYQKFSQYELRGTEGNKGSQGSLFKPEFCLHKGNEEANRLLEQQIENRENVYRESGQGTAIQSSGKIEKKALIEDFLEKIREKLPFIRIKTIDAKKFSDDFIASWNPTNKAENYEDKKARIREWIDHNIKKDNPNLFVIENIHELENKILSQKTLVDEILSSRNCKFLITSNKEINSFPVATLKKGVDSKPDKLEGGFTPELLSHLEKLTIASIRNPDRQSCGEILWTMIENRYPNSKFPKNIIQGIGRNLPDPAIFNAVIDEIILKCNKGKANFTIDMALEIIQTRKGNFKPELEDVHKIVEKYINEEDENAIQRTPTERRKTIKRYTIYLIKELAHNKYTNEDIANYLKISVPMVNRYYTDAVPYRGLMIPIKENIEKSLTSKEEMRVFFN